MSALTLDEIREKVLKHTITPAEKRAQRVSMVVGLQSGRSGLSRDQVSSLMDEIEGRETAKKQK